MFELQQLRQLVAIEEAGSISAAGEKLHLSQPALSRSMQRLEAELGIPLFERSRNRIVFGALGLRAAESARNLLREAERYAEDLHEFAARLSMIRVGACSPASLWRLAAVIHERFPNHAVLEEQAAGEDLKEGLLGGHYRLILTDEAVSEPGVLSREFLEERLVLELPPDHALCRRSALTIEDLRGLDVLSYKNVGVWRKRVQEHLGFHAIELTELDVLQELAVSSGMPLLRSSLSPSPAFAAARRLTLPILEDVAVLPLFLCAREEDRALFEQLC